MHGVLLFFPGPFCAGAPGTARPDPVTRARELTASACDTLRTAGCAEVTLLTGGRFADASLLRAVTDEAEGRQATVWNIKAGPADFPDFPEAVLAALDELARGNPGGPLALLDIRHEEILANDLVNALAQWREAPYRPVVSCAPVRDHPIQMYACRSITDIGLVHLLETEDDAATALRQTLPDHVITRPFPVEWACFDATFPAHAAEADSGAAPLFWARTLTPGRTRLTQLSAQDAVRAPEVLLREPSGLARFCLRRDAPWMRRLEGLAAGDSLLGLGPARHGPDVALIERDGVVLLRLAARIGAETHYNVAVFTGESLRNLSAGHGQGNREVVLGDAARSAWGLLYVATDPFREHACTVELDLSPQNRLWSFDRLRRAIVLQNGELFHGRQQNPDVFRATGAFVVASAAQVRDLTTLMPAGACIGVAVAPGSADAPCVEPPHDMAGLTDAHVLPFLHPRIPTMEGYPTNRKTPAGVADLFFAAGLLQHILLFSQDGLSQVVCQEFSFFINAVAAFVAPLLRGGTPAEVERVLAGWELPVELAPRAQFFEETFLELDSLNLLRPEALPPVVRVAAAIILSNKHRHQQAWALLEGLSLQAVRPFLFKRQLLPYLPYMGPAGQVLLENAEAVSLEGALSDKARLDWSIQLSGLLAKATPPELVERITRGMERIHLAGGETSLAAYRLPYARLLVKEGYIRRGAAHILRALSEVSPPGELSEQAPREDTAPAALKATRIVGEAAAERFQDGALEELFASAQGQVGLNRFRELVCYLALLARIVPSACWNGIFSTLGRLFGASELHLREARILFQQSALYREELWCLERMLELEAVDLNAKLITLLRLGRFSEALALIPVSSHRDGTMHALLLRACGHYNASVAMLRRLCASGTPSPGTRIQLAVSLLFRGDREKARELFASETRSIPVSYEYAYGWLMLHGDSTARTVLDTCLEIGRHCNGTLPFYLAAKSRLEGTQAMQRAAEEQLFHKATFTLPPDRREAVLEAFALREALSTPSLARAYVEYFFGESEQSVQTRFFIVKLRHPEADPADILPPLRVDDEQASTAALTLGNP